jgi:hypothetical protein
MTAPTPPTIAALDASADEVEAAAARVLGRRMAARKEQQMEALRLSLPVSDPDRHDLDVVADDLFAHLAPGYPPAVTR